MTKTVDAGAVEAAHPPFEGVEKRLVMAFSPETDAPYRQLRAFPQSAWDKICASAQCTILSKTHNDHCTSYVLSESSLFVFDHEVLLKTCGTTTILFAIKPIVALAHKAGLKLQRIFFTHLDFSFPTNQIYPHGNFDHECQFLDGMFNGTPYQLGATDADSYKIYVADRTKRVRRHSLGGSVVEPASPDATDTILEVQMFDLDEAVMRKFYKSDGVQTGAEMTADTGIDSIMPGSVIDDVAFDPCGYSMNGIRSDSYWTVHVTPEPECSYVSFETNSKDAPFARLVHKVVELFRPGRFCVNLLHLHDDPVARERNLDKFRLADFDLKHKSTSLLAGGEYEQTCWAYTLRTRRAPAADIFSVDLAQLLKGSSSSSDEETATASTSDGELENETLVVARASVGDGDGDEAEDAGNGAADGKKVAFVPPPSTSGTGASAAPAALPDVAALELDAETRTLASAAVSAPMTDLADAAEAIVAHTTALAVADTRSDTAFFVCNLGMVARKALQWKHELPSVVAHYAVKCNPDPQVVRVLAALGCGFDCSSLAEIKMVLDAGIAADRIVYANPVKARSHLEFARDAGVPLTTVDSTSELAKMRDVAPEMGILVRIATDDSNAQCRLSQKYGTPMHRVREMLRQAHEFGLHVRGVSFHVGSGQSDFGAFQTPLQESARIFALAEEMGLPPMDVLDIGGGFPAVDTTDISLPAVAATIRPLLGKLFGPHVKFISEPGRFFVGNAYTLAVPVIGRRGPIYDDEERAEAAAKDAIKCDGNAASTTLLEYQEETSMACDDSDAGTDSDGDAGASGPEDLEAVRRRREHAVLTQRGGMQYIYYLADGVYSSFSCLLFDHASVSAMPLVMDGQPAADVLDVEEHVTVQSVLFGPTCDGLDRITSSAELPVMTVGDWLRFDAMGAYTVASASSFNGIEPTRVKYVIG